MANKYYIIDATTNVNCKVFFLKNDYDFSKEGTVEVIIQVKEQGKQCN